MTEKGIVREEASILTKAFNDLRYLVFGATRETLFAERSADASVVAEDDDELRSKPERKRRAVLSGQLCK